jgi:hypothetical protein
MEFTIMCLRFPPRLPGQDGPDVKQPEFIPLANFSTHGAVMNVFLLDPNSRVLAAYIWLADSKSIGLYVLPDWNVKEYALLDTTISCVCQLPFYLYLIADNRTVSDWKLVMYPARRYGYHSCRGL